MKRILLVTMCITMLALTTRSQKRIANHPFEFSKKGLAMKNYKCFFLQDAATKQFMLVLRDNEKAEYILFDDKLKKVTSFSPPDGLKQTVFSFDDAEYLGGTAANGKFHFAYKVLDRKFIGSNSYYQVETVDPLSKKVSDKQLFEIPKEEQLMISFGNFGQYFSITANNKSGELVIYGLNSSGESFTKKIKVVIPLTSSKKRLADYLSHIKLTTDGADEEPELESATEKVKLFHSADKISIIVNEGDEPSQVIEINTADYSYNQKSVDHSQLTKDEKGKSYVNSFLSGDKLYSIVLNKKNIRVAIYNAGTGELLKTHEINDATDLYAFAEAPVTETRMGKRTDQKDIDNVKKLIKALDRGSEAIMMYKDKKGRLIVTIGTYDLIKLESGGSNSSHMSYYSDRPGVGTNTYSQQAGSSYLVSVYTPGRPAHISYSANFYKSTHFKLMIDPVNLNIVKGQAPVSVNDQIKDYVSEVAAKSEAKNQFVVNGKQYLGYYSRDEKLYVIEEIFIRK
jgi:hypothetical protein